MTIERDLAWKYLDNLYQSSISHCLARYALALSYDSLPPEVIHQVKRCLLDTLGCAIGAYDAPGFLMCENAVKQLGGHAEATVFGSGLRTNIYNATMVNSLLVRFLDYNDAGGGGHNSDSIPAILAAAEKTGTTTRELITAIVISYELGARFGEAVGFRGDGGKGWNFDIRAAVSMPATLGRILGLNEEQIVNAIGICASHSFPLGILDTDNEENTMSKNLRFGFGSCEAIIACLLAKQGFTGPVRVIEGENGLDSVVFRGCMDKERLIDFSGWRILKTRHKPLCLHRTSIGHVLATLSIVNEHDLKPEDIAEVKIKCPPSDAHHTTALPKKYPRNAETADHSSFFANACAIKYRKLGPETFEPERFTDPVILELIEKISIEGDPGLTGASGISEITTTASRTFKKRQDDVHGFGNDPLTDAELEEKFSSMAMKYMDKEQIQEIFNLVWNLEKLDRVGNLVRLMTVFQKI